MVTPVPGRWVAVVITALAAPANRTGRDIPRRDPSESKWFRNGSGREF